MHGQSARGAVVRLHGESAQRATAARLRLFLHWLCPAESPGAPREEAPCTFALSRIFAVALLAGACGLAIGATKTTAFAVSATVVSNCIINLGIDDGVR